MARFITFVLALCIFVPNAMAVPVTKEEWASYLNWLESKNQENKLHLGTGAHKHSTKSGIRTMREWTTVNALYQQLSDAQKETIDEAMKREPMRDISELGTRIRNFRNLVVDTWLRPISQTAKHLPVELKQKNSDSHVVTKGFLSIAATLLGSVDGRRSNFLIKVGFNQKTKTVYKDVKRGNEFVFDGVAFSGGYYQLESIVNSVLTFTSVWADTKTVGLVERVTDYSLPEDPRNTDKIKIDLATGRIEINEVGSGLVVNEPRLSVIGGARRCEAIFAP